MYINYKKLFWQAKEEIQKARDYYETVTENCEQEEDECVYYSGYCSGLDNALSILNKLQYEASSKSDDDF